MSRCKSCDAEVVWAEFESGKKSPFDMDRRVTREGESRWVLGIVRLPRGQVVQEARQAEVGEWGVTNHFASCPDADQHRRG